MADQFHVLDNEVAAVARETCLELLDGPNRLRKMMLDFALTVRRFDVNVRPVLLPPLLNLYERRDIAITQRALAGEPVKNRAFRIAVHRAHASYKREFWKLQQLLEVILKLVKRARDGQVVYHDDDPPPSAA